MLNIVAISGLQISWLVRIVSNSCHHSPSHFVSVQTLISVEWLWPFNSAEDVPYNITSLKEKVTST